MMNETEDIVYRCKDCSKYNLCNYYYRRKETSQICHYFELAERKTGKWIPVTEQLPEKADSYLVTYLDESGVYAGLVEFVECAYWTGLRWQKDCDDLEDVIAWMPLPEPYKEVEE